MDLKKINKQIADAASHLPTELCKISPALITPESILALQQDITNSANLIENTNAVIKLLAEEVQNLRDEINQLKGEQGKPNIRPQSKSSDDNSQNKDDDDNDPNAPTTENKDISSEDERNSKNKAAKTRRTNDDIKISRTEIVTIDKSILPTDAVFKGYQTYIVQDIKFELDNIEYKREEYYSAANKRSYVADMPIDYNGSGYGFNLKALIITLHHQGKMSQPSIHEFLSTTYGVQIAKSTISRILTNDLDLFHKEKAEIVSSGLMATTYAHFDDTGGRVRGKNYYVHVLCSPYFTSYFTRKHKDRMTVLEILCQGEMPTSDLEQLLQQALGDGYATAKKQIIEASAIIGYQQLPHALQILVCDDAPQFKQITELLSLCWVHAARHYKKLTPIIPENQRLTDEFIEKLWDYYHKLLDYRDNPNPGSQLTLSLGFDELFSTVTGYNELDERIAKTRSQKDKLLVVLEHPEVPLHNNPAELAARSQARRRDISFQTMNYKGTEAKDTWMTVIQTAIKLKINVFAYVKDRISCISLNLI